MAAGGLTQRIEDIGMAHEAGVRLLGQARRVGGAGDAKGLHAAGSCSGSSISLSMKRSRSWRCSWAMGAAICDSATT